MCNGEFYEKIPKEAFHFFDILVENTRELGGKFIIFRRLKRACQSVASRKISNK